MHDNDRVAAAVGSKPEVMRAIAGGGTIKVAVEDPDGTVTGPNGGLTASANADQWPAHVVAEMRGTNRS